uniref:Uncharacterized protein n=1 Tax=Hippocampus comes TaxID=109280 RepID=A0A3Q3DH27_HIPCM
MMSRSVACVRLPSPDSNSTEPLPDENCHDPKPNPIQACNRFDCPPMWETQEWGECSSRCGDGVERRRVLCKQRLADGSNLELPDSFCSSTVPANQRLCSTERQCTPLWVTSWSQVGLMRWITLTYLGESIWYRIFRTKRLPNADTCPTYNMLAFLPFIIDVTNRDSLPKLNLLLRNCYIIQK